MQRAAWVTYVYPVPSADLDDLRVENAELRSRLEVVEREIADLRAAALQRRTEVRALAEAFPAAMSRRALVVGMTRDLIRHPDKKGAAGRALRKLRRSLQQMALAARQKSR